MAEEGEPPEQPEPADEPVETRTLGEIAYEGQQDLPAVRRWLRQGADPKGEAGLFHPAAATSNKQICK